MDDLEQFCQWYLTNTPCIGAIPFDGAVSKVEEVTSVLCFRSAPFQVQMFIVPGGVVIPEHTHPNVDSIEVYCGGCIDFSHGGKSVAQPEQIAADGPLSLPRLRGQTIRVRPNDRHGGRFGVGGGVFLSVQKWLNGVEPHCVARDYSGEVMGPDHFAKVVFGDPVMRAH